MECISVFFYNEIFKNTFSIESLYVENGVEIEIPISRLSTAHIIRELLVDTNVKLQENIPYQGMPTP